MSRFDLRHQVIGATGTRVASERLSDFGGR